MSKKTIILSPKLTFITFFFLLIFVKSDTCGGNCKNDCQGYCPCGTTKNIQDIEYWCKKYDWQVNCCKCIVNSVSQGNANALQWINFTWSYGNIYNVGLFQINTLSGCSGNICLPEDNLNCAYKIYLKWSNKPSWIYWDSTAKACGC